MSNWIPITDNRKPDDGQCVLVTVKDTALHLALYSRNLYKVDKIAFGDKKNIAGFYQRGADGAYREILGVRAWIAAPRPYLKED